MRARIAISALFFFTLFDTTARAAEESPQSWYREGVQRVWDNSVIALESGKSSQRMARNIILFVGDGMGISTLTAARILAGQQLGGKGEEHELHFETFPHLALAKTYNSNQQTPDSAGTMTAMMSGIKTLAGVIGVNGQVRRGDCASMTGNEVPTLLELAEIIGLSTGIVTTTRLTHATPAATYAHSVERNFEDDADAAGLPNIGNCTDIARQLIEFPQRFKPRFRQVDGLEVALGGGRRSFLRNEAGADPENRQAGERQDGRDLVQEWLSRYDDSAYVWNRQGLQSLDLDKTRHLLGLFESSHMQYEADRAADPGGEPSLSEMTRTAIDMLSRNENGFFLMVESGRIDHAHHAVNAYRALTDTIELSRAVKVADEMTSADDTLIIVTADHSHVFTMAGYPTRGNPILGKVIGNDASGAPQTGAATAADDLPYTTLGYINGHGHHVIEDSASASDVYEQPVNMAGRADLTDVDTEHKGFHAETLVPLSSETHGGEDVAVYARGPGAALVNGLIEQHVLYHIMNRAGKYEERAQAKGWRRP